MITSNSKISIRSKELLVCGSLELTSIRLFLVGRAACERFVVVTHARL